MSQVDILKLTGGIFSGSHAVSTVTPFTDAIRYYEFKVLGAKNDRVAARIRSSLVMALMRQRNSEQTTDSAEDALAYILTGSFLLFPELATHMKGSNTGKYDPEVINIAASMFETKFLPSQEPPRDDVEGSEEGSSAQPPSSVSVELASLEVGIQDWTPEPREVAARWGLEMFPIGKNVTLTNIEGFRTNRVKSIKGVYTALDEHSSAFADDLLPTLEVLKSVERAFNLYPAIRLGIADFWVNMMLTGGKTMTQEAYLVIFKMTENFGFAAPSFIMDFLHAYPIVAEHPEFKPIVSKFLSAVEQYMREPQFKRGFLKVRFGSKHRLFSTSSKGALLAAAVAFKTQTEESARNFMDIAPYSAVLARLNEFLISKGERPISFNTAANATTKIMDV